jgi:GxxExxY protein
MNTDKELPDLQGRNKTDFLLKEETRAIIGCAFEVLNELGHGLNEKCYENALVVEFRLRGIGFSQQRQFEVLYKSERVGLFIPDLIAFDQVIVDTKVIDRITDTERGQMINYLRITKLRVGLILNFNTPGWSGSELSSNCSPKYLCLSVSICGSAWPDSSLYELPD